MSLDTLWPLRLVVAGAHRALSVGLSSSVGKSTDDLLNCSCQKRCCKAREMPGGDLPQ